MITKGPIIKGELYLLVGSLLWALHCILIFENAGALSGAVSGFAGYMGIVLTVKGMYVLIYVWSKRASGEEGNDEGAG